jgi:hypothetical protein
MSSRQMSWFGVTTKPFRTCAGYCRWLCTLTTADTCVTSHALQIPSHSPAASHCWNCAAWRRPWKSGLTRWTIMGGNSLGIHRKFFATRRLPNSGGFFADQENDMHPLTQIYLQSLPLYLDGSDGSMWPVNDAAGHWHLCLTDPNAATRRFIRVSDLIAAIETVSKSPSDSPVSFPVADSPPVG